MCVCVCVCVCACKCVCAILAYVFVVNINGMLFVVPSSSVILVDHNQLRNDILRKMLSITGIKICIVPESLLIIAVGSFIFGRA